MRYFGQNKWTVECTPARLKRSGRKVFLLGGKGEGLRTVMRRCKAVARKLSNRRFGIGVFRPGRTSRNPHPVTSTSRFNPSENRKKDFDETSERLDVRRPRRSFRV